MSKFISIETSKVNAYTKTELMNILQTNWNYANLSQRDIETLRLLLKQELTDKQNFYLIKDCNSSSLPIKKITTSDNKHIKFTYQRCFSVLSMQALLKLCKKYHITIDSAPNSFVSKRTICKLLASKVNMQHEERLRSNEEDEKDIVSSLTRQINKQVHVGINPPELNRVVFKENNKIPSTEAQWNEFGFTATAPTFFVNEFVAILRSDHTWTWAKYLCLLKDEKNTVMYCFQLDHDKNVKPIAIADLGRYVRAKHIEDISDSL
jgi:hypothetical protein